MSLLLWSADSNYKTRFAHHGVDPTQRLVSGHTGWQIHKANSALLSNLMCHRTEKNDAHELLVRLNRIQRELTERKPASVMDPILTGLDASHR